MNTALQPNRRRQLVEREVEAAQRHRKVVDQIVRGRVAAKLLHDIRVLNAEVGVAAHDS